jgi:hypothetical protein
MGKFVVTGGKHHFQVGKEITDVQVLRPGEIIGDGEPEGMTQERADDLGRRFPDRFVPYAPPPPSAAPADDDSET